jgi:hypothetical protein
VTVKPLKSDEKVRTTVNQNNGPKEKERADKRVEQAERKHGKHQNNATQQLSELMGRLYGQALRQSETASVSY